MVNILPSSPAETLCLSLIEDLQMLTCVPRMVGILVCTDGTVLKAVSGRYEEALHAAGFADPAYDISSYTGLLSRYDRLIKGPIFSAASAVASASDAAASAAASASADYSRECWAALKKLYAFHCFDSKIRTLEEIFPSAPSGTGDCCTVKLLNECYRRGLKPASMAEFLYEGRRRTPVFYPPCDARCRPLLKHIIGLDIIYFDSEIVVVNKPSGLLAIEGKGEDKQDCIASRVRSFYDFCIPQPCVHRLDQATSGLMVLGLTQKSHDILSRAFEERRVSKTYEAVVLGDIKEKEGVIDLPLRADIDHRPHQIVDFVNGKKAVTRWQRIGTYKIGSLRCTRLSLQPETGRTHQLRVHCAQGLGAPIVGDALYGGVKDSTADGTADIKADLPQRLLLQAKSLSFTHPVTGNELTFTLERDF